jgi:predicted RNase H-like HicB family nuclease
MKEHYLVIIEKGAKNFSAYSPDIPGCIATGKTVEETVRNMREAVYLHLEDLCEQGEDMPESLGLTAYADEIESDSGDIFTFIPVELPVSMPIAA